MANVETARLKMLHARLGPLGSVQIETGRVNGSVEQLTIHVRWRYTLVIGKPSRRMEVLEERTSQGHSLFDALNKALADVDALEKDLKDGGVQIGRPEPEHY